MSEIRATYTTTPGNGDVKVISPRIVPERELALGVRRLLLSMAKLIEVYCKRKWG